MANGVLSCGDGVPSLAGDPGFCSPVFVQVLTELEAVAGSVDGILAARLSGLSDAESRECVRLFERVFARVQAARLCVIADLDARPEAVAGAAAGRVAATFLVGACRVGVGQAARDVAAARALPIASAASAAGGVDAASVAAHACGGDLSAVCACGGDLSAVCACGADAPVAAGGLGEPVAPGSLLGDGSTCRLPVLAGAFAAGSVSRAHVDVAVKAVARIPSGLLREVDEDGVTGLARVDAFLTEQARRHCPTTLDRLVRHLVEVVDPDGAAGFDPQAYQRRSCVTAVDSLGMLVGRFVLDPAGALVVSSALDAFSSIPAPGSAVDEHGVVIDVVDDRSREQRRADALVHIAHRAMTSPDAPLRAQVSVVATLTQVQRAARAHTRHLGAGAPRYGTATSPATCVDMSADAGTRIAAAPASARTTTTSTSTSTATGSGTDTGVDTVTEAGAHADAEPWLATVDGRGPISDAVLAHATCDAILTRLVLGPTGTPLDVGRSMRLATAAQRRALTARDRGCVIPGCGVPATGCDAHHLVHWGDGGATDLDNLALLCPRHHTAHHQGIWGIHMRDGTPWVIPPPWIDPHQTPVLNTTHHDATQATHLGQHLHAPTRPAS